MTVRAEFESFLECINIEKYRKKYSPIKTVELDLPKSIQPLNLMYEVYWNKRERSDWLDFEDFYCAYEDSLQTEIESFRQKSRFSEDTFYLGLPARIYRHWASILTQIQAAYVLEEMYGNGSVVMETELDQKGTDIVLKHPYADLYFQIKKETYRKDINPTSVKNTKKKKRIKITYAVPPKNKYIKRIDENGNPIMSKPWKRWHEEYGDKLKILNNNFVVFKPAYFELKNIIPEFADAV